MSDKWMQGRVIENRHWTEALFSLRVEAPRLRFEAGQFVRIALDVDGERVARPFSFVNPPEAADMEFYGIVVPHGPLSPRLARLAPGDALQVATNPAGFLVLSELPQTRTLWLVSTGTGIAPFLSMLQTPTPWARFENVVLVHAVRHAPELVYAQLINDKLRDQPRQFRYVSMVSRESAPGSLTGRIPAAVQDGRLEAAAGLQLLPESSHVMLCGNPDMLKDTTAVLMQRGMRKHRRRTPGHITVESFW
jgi:ferredoxin/flavodoxin---NADP+ reductase